MFKMDYKIEHWTSYIKDLGNTMKINTLILTGLCWLNLTISAESADTIYYNGTILTIDDAYPKVQAVAVKGGKILAVGGKDEVFVMKAEATTLVDLEGRTMLPGFVDYSQELVKISYHLFFVS